MRHLTTKLMIPVMVVMLLLSMAPKPAEAQVPCNATADLLSLGAQVAGTVGASIGADIGLIATGFVTAVADKQTHALLVAQTASMAGHMNAMITSQSAICENLLAVLEAIGYVGPHADVPTVNLPLYAAKAYKYYIGSSKSVARNSGDYGTLGSSIPRVTPTANSGRYDRNDARSQGKRPTKSTYGNSNIPSNIPDVLRAPGNNPGNYQTQPGSSGGNSGGNSGGSGGFNPYDPSTKQQPRSSGGAGFSIPNGITIPFNPDPAADPFRDNDRNGTEQRRPAFIDIPQQAVKPDPKPTYGGANGGVGVPSNLPGGLGIPGTTPGIAGGTLGGQQPSTATNPLGYDPADPLGLGGISEEINGQIAGVTDVLADINPDQILGDLLADLNLPDINGLLNDVLGPVLNQVGQVQQYFEAFNGILGGITGIFGDLFGGADSILEQVSRIWGDTVEVLGGLFDNPMESFGITPAINQLTDQLAMLTMPLNQATNFTTASLLDQTGASRFLDNIEGALANLNPGEFAASYPGSDWAGPANPFNVDPKEHGISSIQEIETTLNTVFGAGPCLADAAGRKEAECISAHRAFQKLSSTTTARRMASSNFARIHVLPLFLKKLVMGDELTGECDDLARDENCLTLVNMMRHSMNLRHDIQVQTAVQYTDLLVNMLQLETMATSGFYDGMDKMIAAGTAPGGG